MRPVCIRSIGSLAIAGILLAGCGTATRIATVTPEIEQTLLSDLKAGTAILDCGMSCEGSWSGAADRMFDLYKSSSWDRLAVTVLQIGRRRDLGYFYMGAAAEGLGAHEAAVKYYRMAGGLATDWQETFKCTGVNVKILFGDDCHGFVFPRDIYKPLWAVEATLVALHPPKAASGSSTGSGGRSKKHTSANVSLQEGASASHGADQGWITPPPVTR